ncbi:MAG: DegT/DnrJ/EryC1/StrS family aminotransferase [Lachnospiraceae bacterium]|nr:DegT/DnrJ/EryC1/StrS family aminotransferase [Lachnospiraceae bacterium]
MEFRDLKTQYLKHKETIDTAMQKVLLSGHFIGGEPVSQLEEKLADYVGVKHCIACANGTDALQLALMAWEIGPKDAVFVPDLTFFSSGEVVPLVGAVPIFVDVYRETYNIDPDSLRKAVEYVIHNTDLRPRVIVAVDLFGQPAEQQAIREIADQYGLLVLEDAAQAFGGMIGDKKTCSFGDISTTSFFPAKPLGCYGDGGAVFTDDDGCAERLRSIHVHGKGSGKYDNVRIGMNSRLDTIQAAVLLQKLQFFEEEVEACNRVAAKYDERLRGAVKIPSILENMRSSWAQYTICLKDGKEREQVIAQLQADGIPSAVYYPKPMHRQTAFADHLIEAVSCENTEYICERCLSLPFHPYMEDADINAVCESIRKALR